jgi:hypothetical protein
VASDSSAATATASAVPKFSPQDNPAAFHPKTLVRQVFKSCPTYRVVNLRCKKRSACILRSAYIYLLKFWLVSCERV